MSQPQLAKTSRLSPSQNPDGYSSCRTRYRLPTNLPDPAVRRLGARCLTVWEDGTGENIQEPERPCLRRPQQIIPWPPVIVPLRSALERSRHHLPLFCSRVASRPSPGTYCEPDYLGNFSTVEDRVRPDSVTPVPSCILGRHVTRHDKRVPKTLALGLFTAKQRTQSDRRTR